MKILLFPLKAIWFLVKIPFRIAWWILSGFCKELSNVSVSSKRFGSNGSAE